MIAVLSTCNEGNRIKNCIQQILKVTNEIHLVNDGNFDLETLSLIKEFNLIAHEYKKIGCKEPHLAHFFSEMQYIDQDILHLDYDEVISDELCSELSSYDRFPFPLRVNMTHCGVDEYGALRYKSGSTRSSKVIAFNTAHLKMILGLPHKGLIFNESSILLRSRLSHTGDHLNFGLLKLIKRDMGFAKLDGQLRVKRLQCFFNKNYQLIEPDSNFLMPIDRYRYCFPRLFFIPCIIYRLFQSFLWLADVRSLATFKYEVRITISRLVYQFVLLKEIIRNK